MCPDREILSAFFDGEIAAPWEKGITAHVEGCDRCRALLAGMEQTRSALRKDDPRAWKTPMARVRRRILADAFPVRPGVPFWRRPVSLPLPVAVLAAVLLVAFGVTVAVLATRQTMGFIRVTRAPAGGTEYQFAVPYDKVEALLKSMGGAAANAESVMTIPKNVKLIPVGEPRMGKVGEFPRKRP